MRTGLYLVAAGLFILGIGLGIGIERHWPDQSTGEGVSLPEGETTLEHARKHLDPEYVCPMHADVVSKEPGSCPVCGMDLVMREPAVDQRAFDESLPEVAVPPGFMHNFGVRTAKVERGSVSRQVETLGRISRMPQSRVTEVKPGLVGQIVSVADRGEGDEVVKGELLYTVEAPEWRKLQQLFLDAVREDDQTRVTQLRQRLQTLGMQPDRLVRLTETGQVEQTLDVTAPVNGTIVEWGATMGERVDATTRVVTLGGMNRIPVIVSLFEGQGAWVRRGQRITVRVPTMPGTQFEGQVDRTDREINFSTRTLPVYVGFNTTDPRLRYGMLVDVTIHASARDNVLRIPREALIRTERGDRVIVARGEGRFQPVAVEPGLESGDYIEILSGLEEGQEVVVSGQFLIDSESNLMADFRRMETGNDDL